jgi:DNA-binding LacI/PurR family transcriptional regulator
MHQPMGEVGALAAGIVLDQIAGGDPPEPRTYLLPAVLVTRESVTAARR